jgi:hypothetical protein
MLAHIRPSLQWFTCEHRPLFNESFSPGAVSRTIQDPPRAQSPFARSRCYLKWSGSYLPELWYRYMTESDNYHGGTFTRWIAALSAAT